MKSVTVNPACKIKIWDKGEQIIPGLPIQAKNELKPIEIHVKEDGAHTIDGISLAFTLSGQDGEYFAQISLDMFMPAMRAALEILSKKTEPGCRCCDSSYKEKN